MAATHLTPSGDTMTIEEGVEFLRDTGHPVTRSQLSHWLADRGTQRERHGRTDYYPVADILEAHRDHVDRRAAAAR